MDATKTEPLTLSPAEAKELAGIGINQLYQAIARGEVPGVLRIGRKIRISRRKFLAWLDGEDAPKDAA